MAVSLGTVTVDLQITTSTTVGGPVILGAAEIEVPMSMESTSTGARLMIAQDVLRHEIAGALIEAARQIEAGD